MILAPIKKRFTAHQRRNGKLRSCNPIIRNESFSPALGKSGYKPFGSHWVFMTKRNPDGSTQYKAGHGIKGDEQIEYSETYAPVSKLTTFRLVRNLAVRNNCKIIHLNIVTAFLTLDVKDDTQLMELLRGCPEHAGQDEIIVVRLRKAL